MQLHATRYARRWHEWKLGETRIIRTLDCWQIQSQVGKVRKKHPECSGWRDGRHANWTMAALKSGG